MRAAVYFTVALVGVAFLVRHIVQEMADDRARRRALLRDGFERCAEYTARDREAVVGAAYPEILEPGASLDSIYHRGGR